MGMARNDIDFALRDVLQAGQTGTQDFKYRIRLLSSHLLEAISALRRYRENFEEVRKLLNRTSPEAKQLLKLVIRTAQDAAPIESMRHATFHYPAPDPAYNPSSDAALRDVLAAMDDFGVHVYVTHAKNQVSMTFADEAAFRLACGLHRPREALDELTTTSERTRDGALAFHKWFEYLMVAYIDYRGLTIGDPVPVEPHPQNPKRDAS